MKKLIIATRGSKLALWQSNFIKDELERIHKDKGLSVELKVIKTTGDKILDVPLSKIGGKGLFTKELEEAMLAGEAHFAVHSLKDVPTEFPNGLILSVITKREDRRDSLLSEKYSSLDNLPKSAIVGTTSLRRKMQILNLRPDLIIKDLRGNVDTRIRKLKDGEFDAIILAQAGMNRLGFNKEVKYMTPIDNMIPAMGQGALGIESIDNQEVIDLISVLNNNIALMETRIERDFIAKLEGGCQIPIGVNAKIENEKVYIKAIIGLPNGKEMLEENLLGHIKYFKSLGNILAENILKKGARDLLDRALKMC